MQYSYHSPSHLVLNVGTDHEQGPMFDFPSLLLTEDYPYSLYQYNLDSLGRRKKDFVLSKPRCEKNVFDYKISRQTSPNDGFVLCCNNRDFFIANSALMDVDAVAEFDWPHLTN